MSGQDKIPNYTKKFVYELKIAVEVDEGTYFPDWTAPKPTAIVSMENSGMTPDEIADTVREIRVIRSVITPINQIHGVEANLIDIIPTHTSLEPLVECSVCGNEMDEDSACWAMATPYCYECWDAPFTKEG